MIRVRSNNGDVLTLDCGGSPGVNSRGEVLGCFASRGGIRYEARKNGAKIFPGLGGTIEMTGSSRCFLVMNIF